METPIGVLRESIKAVPAVKYALGVAGIVAAAAGAADESQFMVLENAHSKSPRAVPPGCAGQCPAFTWA